MPTGNTIPVPPEFPASFPLTEPERDLEAWYFFAPAPRAGAEVSDRPDGPKYIGIPIATAALAVLAVAPLLTTGGCGHTDINRQFAAVKRALVAERERVAELHGGLR